jgi:hypothetical protein
LRDECFEQCLDNYYQIKTKRYIALHHSDSAGADSCELNKAPPGRHATPLITRARVPVARITPPDSASLLSFPFPSPSGRPVAVAVRRLGLPLPLRPPCSLPSPPPLILYGPVLSLARADSLAWQLPAADSLQWTWCRRGVPAAEQPWRRSRRYAI